MCLALLPFTGCAPADAAGDAEAAGAPTAEAAGAPTAEAHTAVAPSLPPVVLEGGAHDLTSLARRTVEAIARRDTAGLEVLRLTEHEHNHLVFPRLPAGQPPQNFPVDIAWANIRTRNSVAVLRLFGRYGGRELAFDRVECLGETERFEGFEVATDCWTEFAEADGGTYRAQLFRHTISADGGFKVFRFYD